MRSAAAGPVYGDHGLILVRPDLHVVWRGHDKLPNPGDLASLATGNGKAAVALLPLLPGRLARASACRAGTR
jgi:hypothetical protein